MLLALGPKQLQVNMLVILRRSRKMEAETSPRLLPDSASKALTPHVVKAHRLAPASQNFRVLFFSQS